MTIVRIRAWIFRHRHRQWRRGTIHPVKQGEHMSTSRYAGVIAALALTTLSAAGVQAPPPDKPAAVVAVAAGQVSGTIVDDVAIYRGIPFAAPPLGEWRWRAPQPAQAWTGVRDGTKFGATCTASEDCLYVNVYKPADAGRPGDNIRLPVMVWIYGGGFTSGASNQYEGTNFVKRGVVYVSFNYRLGRAGWFSHPALTKNAPGNESVSNYGLQDQIAALKWVQANIGAFGGDNRNVTIFGESAGGVSVNYLMTVPEAGGLFHKVISESGFGRTEPAPLGEAEQAGAAFFSTLGINGDSTDTLKAMRAVPFTQLAGRLALGAAGPILDGKLLKMGTAEAFTKGLETKVPYMFGSNSNEASLWPAENAPARLDVLRSTAGGLGPYDAAGKGEPARTIGLIVTDYYNSEPDRLLARTHTASGQPVYRYHFSYVPPSARTGLGLAHGGEIGYVFGRSTANPEDAATSAAANAYWAAFAKSANPGSAGGPAWPRYDRTTEAALEFGVDGVHARTNFQTDRLDWIEQHSQQITDSSAAAGVPVAAGRTTGFGRTGAPGLRSSAAPR
jgi:para-nitrobenzyl esterase